MDLYIYDKEVVEKYININIKLIIPPIYNITIIIIIIITIMMMIKI